MIKKFLVCLLIDLLGYIPLPVSYVLGSLIGATLWVSSNRSRNTILANLRLCFPGHSPSWYRAMGRQSMIESVRSIMEAPWLWCQDRRRLQSLLKESEGIEFIQAGGNKGEAIIVTSHLGSWEFSGLWLATQRPITSLYRPPRIRALENVMKQARSHSGACLVSTTTSGLRELHRALGRGEAIGLLPDQTPKGRGGVFAPFFGKPAYTMRLVGNLARRNRSPVVIVFCERLPWGRGFRLHAIQAGDAIYSDNPSEAAAEINHCVERLILISPQQYLWSYSRFSRQPGGGSDSTR